MAVELEIPDGDPWWASPNVWCVPGEDPEGDPGDPVAGQPCYSWARVSNRGRTAAHDATVRFYWANPSVGFDRTTATPIGTAFVSLDGGATADVLCLTPWVPEYVNEGHVCVLAEAFHDPADPLPSSASFDVPGDRHVAQRNLTVVAADERTTMFALPLEVHNPARVARPFTVSVEPVPLQEIRDVDAFLGPGVEEPREGKVAGGGLVRTPCPDAEEVEQATPAVDGVELDANERTGFTLVGALEGEAAAVNVTQRADERDEPVGGLTALVLSPELAKQRRGATG